jgi:hypothetical protein
MKIKICKIPYVLLVIVGIIIMLMGIKMGIDILTWEFVKAHILGGVLVMAGGVLITIGIEGYEW